MGKIRQYGPRVNPVDASVGRVSQNPLAFGQEASRANQQLGQAIQGFGNKLFQMQERREVLEVQENISRIQNEISQEFTQSYRTADPKNQNFGTEFLKKSKEKLDSMRQGYSTRAGREAYERARSSIYNSLQAKATEAQASLDGRAALQNYEGILSNKSSYLVNNPGEFENIVKETQDAMTMVEQTGAFDGAKLDGERQNANAIMAESAIKGWVNQSPTVAVSKIESGEFDKYFRDGRQKAQLLRYAKGTLQTRRDAVKSNQDKLDRLQRTDPYGHAKELGLNYKPFYLQSMEDAEERENFRKEYQALDPRNQKPPLLDANEEAYVLKELRSNNSEKVTGLLQNFRDNMTTNQYKDFVDQIFKKDPALGVSLGVSKSNPSVARDIALGSGILDTDKTIKVSLDEKKMKEQFNSFFGNAVGSEPGEVEFKQSHYEATKALLALEKYNGKIGINQDPSKTDVENALSKIIGKPVKYNGKKVLTFRGRDGEFVDQDYFEEIVEEMDLNDLDSELTYPNGSPLTKDEFEDAQFVTRGEGKYFIQVNGRYISKKGSDEPYLLDMKKIESTGKFKKPGFFDRNF